MKTNNLITTLITNLGMKAIVSFIIIILMFSCTKFGRTHTAKGKVINPITGEGIPNAQMKILKHTLGLPGGLKSVKETTSDANGNYEISKSGLYSYSLRCELASDYYKIGWYDNGEKIATASSDLALKMGKTKNINFYAVPYGEISINIKNIGCVDSNDKIELFFDGGEFDGNTFTIGFMTVLYGCQDIPGTPVKSSMGNKYFHWNITKNGVTNTIYDTIFVTETGVTNLDVYY